MLGLLELASQSSGGATMEMMSAFKVKPRDYDQLRTLLVDTCGCGAMTDVVDLIGDEDFDIGAQAGYSTLSPLGRATVRRTIDHIKTDPRS